MSKKIYINPGQSDKDPGAVGYERERDLNVTTAHYMNAYLLANYDCETRMNPGTMGKLADICKDANSWGAVLFVSIHNNAGGGDGYAMFKGAKAMPSPELLEVDVFEAYVKRHSPLEAPAGPRIIRK